MNLVELELDETLADFEVQDWIDNVFSVQYPDVKARIKKGCSGLCHKKDEWHYPSKNELPNCDDKTLLVFIANDYYERNGEIKKIKRTVLGFYKKAFINDNMKLFVEKSKGYEAEHLPKAVIAWKEIVLPKEIENA